MLLILLFVIIFAAGVTLLTISHRRHKHWRNEYDKARCVWNYTPRRSEEEEEAEQKRDIAYDKKRLWEGIKDFAIGCVIILSLALFICGLVLTLNHSTAQRDWIYQEETYTALKYAETDLDATIDFSYYEEIIKYNAEVRKHQRWNDSLWLDWFVPDFWDNLPLFEYDLVGPPAA